MLVNNNSALTYYVTADLYMLTRNDDVMYN